MKIYKVLAMSFPKDIAEDRVQKLAEPLAKHIIYLLGFSINNDNHHWMNNGVISITSTIASLSYLKKNKRLKRGWLKRTLYSGYFGEPQSLTRNTIAFLSHKSDYTPLFSRKTSEHDFLLLQKDIEAIYDLIIDLILTTDYTANEEVQVKHKIEGCIKRIALHRRSA